MVVTPRHLYGAIVLLGHVQAMGAHVVGVRQAQATERIHKMRVASRRLRTALGLFGDVLPARKFKNWAQCVKKVTRALGAARDADVQIEFLDRFIVNLPADRRRQLRPGLDRLRLRLRQQRDGLQGGVIKAMDRLESSNTVLDMQQAMRKIEARGRKANIKSGSAQLQREARRLIGRRREQLLAFAPCVHEPDQVEQHHEMRIAAKHLRYTMEAYGELFDGKLKPQIKIVRRMQTQLGDVHDADVWIEHIQQFIDAERARFGEFFGHDRGMAKLTGGLEYLRDDRIAARRQLHEHFAAFWDQTIREDQWNQLAAALASPLPDKAAPAQPQDNDEVTDE